MEIQWILVSGVIWISYRKNGWFMTTTVLWWCESSSETIKMSKFGVKNRSIIDRDSEKNPKSKILYHTYGWGSTRSRNWPMYAKRINPIGFICIIRILVPQEDTCLAHQRDARVHLHFSAACSLPLIRYALVVLRDFLSVFDRRSSCATATSSIKEPRRPLDRRFLLCPVWARSQQRSLVYPEFNNPLWFVTINNEFNIRNSTAGCP